MIDETEIEAFLARPECHQGHMPTRIDTHGATLFLGPDKVLKIKKSIYFPYLDFSTPERRKAAIEHEFERGLEIAPQIYIDTVPITREANGELALNGNGEVAEWALRMNRFDEDHMLSRMADAGNFSIALAEYLGEQVADMHRAAKIMPGGAAAMGEVMRENFSSLATFPNLFAPQKLEALTASPEAAFAKIQPLLDQRGTAGFVRLCHGDLHLGNIVMLEGVPTPFDAIEFDDNIAIIDTFYDLAYLLMDLWERRLPDCANRLLNRYLAITGDEEGLATLPLFLSMRAAIRAKVLAAAGHDDEAQTYFEWAIEFLVPRQVDLTAIGGFSGTGKTTTARLLAPHLGPIPGAIIIRTDVERKRLAGVAETAALPKSSYTKDASAKVYDRVHARAATVLRAGHSAIIDAVSARKSERDALATLAKDQLCEFHGIWLQAPKQTLVERVGKRRGDASDADANVIDQQLTYDVGEISWPTISASGTPAETAERALETISRSNAKVS